MTHNDDAPHECELHCGRPAPHTWICWDCHAETLALVDGFTEEDMHTLLLIARKEATPALQRTAHTTHVYGPAIPLNLGALIAHHNLTTRWDGTLDQLPHQVDAARTTHQIRSTCQHARNMLDGETEQWTDEQRERVRNMPPMQTRTLIPWLREHCGIRVTSSDISNWKQRRGLAPVRDEPGEHPYYRAEDVLRARAGVT